MARRTVRPVRQGVGTRRALGTPAGLDGTLRANSGPQTTAIQSLWALHGTFLPVASDLADAGADVYVTGVSLNSGGGPRLHCIVRSRDGRYVHTWQARRKIGELKIRRVGREEVAHSFLTTYLGKSGRVCNARESVRLALRFLEMLGEINPAIGRQILGEGG
jgi:hypothetical protein